MRVTNQSTASPKSVQTKHAHDRWESARFQAVFGAQANSVKVALSRPAHQRVTPAVRRLIHRKFNKEIHEQRF